MSMTDDDKLFVGAIYMWLAAQEPQTDEGRTLKQQGLLLADILLGKRSTGPTEEQAGRAMGAALEQGDRRAL